MEQIPSEKKGEWRDCPRCDGTGKEAGEKCSRCSGSGKVKD